MLRLPLLRISADSVPAVDPFRRAGSARGPGLVVAVLPAAAVSRVRRPAARRFVPGRPVWRRLRRLRGWHARRLRPLRRRTGRPVWRGRRQRTLVVHGEISHEKFRSWGILRISDLYRHPALVGR